MRNGSLNKYANVLVRSTTFSADLWSFARYLDQRDDFGLIVEMTDPERFSRQTDRQKEVIVRLHP